MLFPFFLVWGSFLNMLGYRLLSGDSLLKTRSFCPSCKNNIYWYDNIPLLSWILLKGRCRFCKKTISWLYPFIEFLSLLIFSGLFYYTPQEYRLAYFIFFSALIVTIRTDLQEMLISRWTTIYLIPLGFIFSYANFLPITLYQSILGAISAYLILYLIGYVFYLITKKIGMGEGDSELLAFIGAFTGILGWWFSLLIGSLLGSFIGLIYLGITKKGREAKIPFGPFLALGAIIYTLFQMSILRLIFID